MVDGIVIEVHWHIGAEIALVAIEKDADARIKICYLLRDAVLCDRI